MIKKTLFFTLSLISLSLKISEATALTRMFESLGNNSNYSSPGSFQDQAAGYYTGGGFVMRQKSQALQPIQISLPHMGAGCRGIDAYFGGFSFIKGKQIATLGKNILSQSPTYGLQLFLKKMASEIENLFSQLRKTALDANASMIEECRMVEQIYASALPKGSAFQEAACIDVRKQGEEGGDWFGAKEKCKKPQEIQEAIEEKRKKNPDLMVGDFNLVWHVLQKMPEMKNNQPLAEFILSTVGTIISRREGDHYRIQMIEGKADNRTYLTAWLKGGETERLSCDEKDKCLNPTWVKHIIDDQESTPTMLTKVSEKIFSIRDKYLSKASLTNDEYDFLNDTVNIPVYRYIQVSAAVGTQFLMQDALEYVAISILLHQFEKVSSEILSHIESLQSVQMEDTQIQKFKQNLQKTRLRLQNLMSDANQGALWRLNQMMKSYEQNVVIERG